MKDRYFSVEVKPTIPASNQHSAAFSVGDVLFDWVEFEIPKGTSRLIGATMITRPKGNATPTGNKFGSFLIFSKTNTVSYGTPNAAPTKTPTNDFLGLLELEDDTSFTIGAGTNVGMSGRSSNTASQANVLLTGSQTGSNVGYDKLYIAAQANGQFDFRSINAVNETGFDAGAQTVITMDGTSMDVREHFIEGDVLHAQDDAVLGTLSSADSATQITLTAANTAAIAEDDVIYNIHPIRIILHFEK